MFKDYLRASVFEVDPNIFVPRPCSCLKASAINCPTLLGCGADCFGRCGAGVGDGVGGFCTCVAFGVLATLLRVAETPVGAGSEFILVPNDTACGDVLVGAGLLGANSVGCAGLAGAASITGFTGLTTGDGAGGTGA